MTTQRTESEIIFSDDFNGSGPVSSSKWDYNHWRADDNPAFYNGTNVRQSLPVVSDGVMRLRLDTYHDGNRDYPQYAPSFLGNEAISLQTFSLDNGPLAFEARMKSDQTQPGVVIGFFTFAGPRASHDEIDWELMSKRYDVAQTNPYHNEDLSEGHPKDHDLPGGQGIYHDYRIEWYKGVVIWKIDGTIVRTETSIVPEKPMNLHFNIWGAPSNWVGVGDPSLTATRDPSQNRVFYASVDSVQVERLAQSAGSVDSENLVGTSAGEHLFAGAGHDSLHGGGGDDVLDGDAGYNVATYMGRAENFALSMDAAQRAVIVEDRSDAEGTDVVVNMQELRFADQTIDLVPMIKAANADAADIGMIIDLYTSYLDRAPDAMGLYFWTSLLSDGVAIDDIAEQFFTAAEPGRFAGKSTAEIVDTAYREILGRAPDADGFAYWVDAVDSGRLNIEDIPLAFILSARSGTAGADGAELIEKAEIAAYFALEKGLSNGEGAKAVLDATDFAAAKALTDLYAADAAGENGQVVASILGIDAADYTLAA
ncbi:family 16 glycosylhydrolase [Chelatococcus asaccharovorans]|uniref:family 16 glycosylhydrolase n=1 Tax=Chelatococcus asaccharovorans TaxID=28210 RepID=UPI00224C676A|nr:family 16 glycosylhydrolase [Chelatococcus asaccharovorans]CAH1670419.1 Beta-glucanase (GH16 family) [Chelatococcus asaccharovorans]CAH1678118.1 Beta-glucanase (GH16 family) [Chelatococcus asaccharovorans]